MRRAGLAGLAGRVLLNSLPPPPLLLLLLLLLGPSLNLAWSLELALNLTPALKLMPPPPPPTTTSRLQRRKPQMALQMALPAPAPPSAAHRR